MVVVVAENCVLTKSASHKKLKKMRFRLSMFLYRDVVLRDYNEEEGGK